MLYELTHTPCIKKLHLVLMLHAHSTNPHLPYTFSYNYYSFVLLIRDKFVMEYCGEVCSLAEFEERKKVYSMEKRRHYYFMSLKADDVS